MKSHYRFLWVLVVLFFGFSSLQAQAPCVPTTLNNTGWTASSFPAVNTPNNVFTTDSNQNWNDGGGQIGNWFAVNMQTPRQFNQVILSNAGANSDYPRGFVFEISNTGNAGDWQEIYWQTNNTSSNALGDRSQTVINLPSNPTAQHFRIRLTAPHNGMYWRISQIIVNIAAQNCNDNSCLELSKEVYGVHYPGTASGNDWPSGMTTLAPNLRAAPYGQGEFRTYSTSDLRAAASGSGNVITDWLTAAETALLQGSANTRRAAGVSNGGYYIEWTNVNGGAGGDAWITLIAAEFDGGGTRTMDVSVNGAVQTTTSENANLRGKRQSLKFQVTEGYTNTVRIARNSGSNNIIGFTIEFPECSTLDKTVVTATPNGCDRIDLSWTAVDDANEYVIHRTNNQGGDRVEIDRVVVPGTTFSHTNLTENTTYFYRVEAVGDEGSSFSDTVSARTAPSANPSPSIAVVAADLDFIELALTLPAGGSNALYRGTSPSDITTPTTYNGTDLSFTDTALAEGTIYYYRLVSTFSASCPTEASVSATTKSSVFIPETFIPETDQACGACTDRVLVGYVTFVAEEGERRDRNNGVFLGGAADESFTIHGTATSGNLTNGTYTITKNPGDVNGPTGLALMADATLQNAIFLTRSNGDGASNAVATYRITGLNRAGSGVNAANVTYCVKVRTRNATAGNCTGNDLNATMQFQSSTGQGISGGGAQGRWLRTNCAGTRGGWDGNNQTDGLRTRGTTAVYENSFRIGANPNNTNDNGFTLQFFSGMGSQDVWGIESIEVWGCLPKEIEVLENGNPVTAREFCENSQITLRATGAGFGNDIKWYSGNTQAAANAAADADVNPAGTGTLFTPTLPAGGQWYVARGHLGREAVHITSRVCRFLTASSVDPEGNPVDGTVFCAGKALTIVASGSSFGNLDNIEWFRGATLASALASTQVIGTGSTLSGYNVPAGIDESEVYVARDATGGYATITITSKFCCPNIEEVFKEDFSSYTNFLSCGNQTRGPYASFAGATTSTGAPLTQYRHASERGDCAVEDGFYAIVRNANNGHGAFRPVVSRTPNKGIFVVNADIQANYFYQIDLQNVCADTQYELSVWYADVTPHERIDIGIMLELWAVGAETPFLTSGPWNSTTTGAASRNSEWHQAIMEFSTPSGNNNQAYMLRLRNAGGGGSGNDLVIDEILVTKCMPPINIESDGQIGEITTCSVEGIELTVNATQTDLDAIAGGNSTLYFQWAEVESDGSLIALIGEVQAFEPAQRATVTTPPAQVGQTRYYQVKISTDRNRVADWSADLACGNDVKSIVFTATIEAGNHITRIEPANPNRCGEGSVSLTAFTSPAGGTINWYDAAGTLLTPTPVADATPWSTPNLTNQTTAFFAEYAGSTCGRRQVVATVNAINTITVDGNTNRLSCVNTALDTNIIFNTTGVTDATVTDLPEGVTLVFEPSPIDVFPPRGTVTISGTPTAIGTFNYTITVNNASNDCPAATASGTITVIAAPILSQIDVPAAVCSGGSLTLTAPIVTNWNGSDPNSPQGWEIETAVASNDFVPFNINNPVMRADNGKLIRYVVRVDCGTVPSNTVAITVNDVPTVGTITAPTAVCSGNHLTLPSVDISENGSTINSQGWQIETAVGSGVFVPFNNPVAYADNGKQIRYFVNGSCGGTVHSDAVTITVNAVPTVAALTAPAPLCAGSTLTMQAAISALNGSTITGYSWRLGAREIGTSENLNYQTTYADNGEMLTLTVNSSCGEVATSGVQVSVKPVPTVSAITSQTICPNEWTAAVALESLPEGASFAWTVVQTANISGASDGSGLSIPATQFTGEAGGTAVYTITPTLDGCVGTAATFTVTVNPTPPAPSVSDVTYCAGATVPPLRAIGSNLLWYTSETGGTGSAAAPTPNTDSEGFTDYWVSQTIAGCESPRARLRVNIIEAIEILLIAQNEEGLTLPLPGNTSTMKREVRLEAIYIRGEIPSSYLWSWDNLSTVTPDNDILVYPIRTTTYKVTAILDEYCSASDEITVSVAPLPNAFVPSLGTGEWSAFPVDAEAPDLSQIIFKNLTVYNRYGQEVYNGDKRWDGTINGGNLAMPGTYFYIITFHDDDVLKGTIEVIKQ